MLIAKPHSILRQHYATVKTKNYLFEEAPRKMYSVSSVFKIVKGSTTAVGCNTTAPPHMLRLIFATYLLEQGGLIFDIIKIYWSTTVQKRPKDIAR